MFKRFYRTFREWIPLCRRIEKLEWEIVAAKTEKEQTKKEVDELKKKNKDLESRINSREDEIRSLERRRDQLATEVGKTSKDFKKMRKERDEYKSKLKEAYGLSREAATFIKELAPQIFDEPICVDAETEE